jgi:hypothetical protein
LSKSLSCIHWRDWHPVCDALSEMDLIALVKGLTLAERHAGWGGGSVSPVIWAYRKLDERTSYRISCEVAQWVIHHSDNEYSPFGGPGKRQLFMARQEMKGESHHPAGLFTELQLEECSRYRQKEQIQIELVEQQKKAKAVRLEQKKQAAAKHGLQKVQQDMARREILAPAVHLNEVDRLRFIVDNKEQPITFFPSEWAEISFDSLSSLDESLKEQLIMKTATQRRGPWRQLYHSLREGK